MDRHTYHHLYLIYKSIPQKLWLKNNESDFKNKDLIEFKLEIDKISFNLRYCLLDGCEEKHLIFGEEVDKVPHDDPITNMLSVLLNDQANIIENHKMTIWVLDLITRLKKLIYPNIK